MPPSGSGDGDNLNPAVDWFLMRPCVGLATLCPPLCKWSELEDGTYDLADVLKFNYVLNEVKYYHDMARE